MLSDSPVSEFYVPKFRNTLFHLHRWYSCLHDLWRWDRVFRNVSTYNSDAGESLKRKNTTSRTRRKFDIKNRALCFEI